MIFLIFFGNGDFYMEKLPQNKKPPAYARGPEGGKNEVLEETITCAVNRFDIL